MTSWFMIHLETEDGKQESVKSRRALIIFHLLIFPHFLFSIYFLFLKGGSSISHHGGPPSENPSSSTSLLQSGPFDRCIWRTIDPNQSLLFSESDPNSDHSQIFAIESPSDDNGYPGHLRVEVQIQLLPPTSNETDSNLGTSTGKVSILYRTKLLDSSSTVITTPVNLTHHWGFNLSCSNSDKVEDEIIDDHHLQIFPSNTTKDSNQVQLLETDSNSGIPTGNYSSTKGTSHDFMNKRKIKDDQIKFPKDGYDHFYIFGPPPSSSSESGIESEKIKPSVILSSESSKLALGFKTNQSGVQLYTANGQPESPASIEAGGERKTLHGKGRGNCKRSAAFLEFAHPHGNFPHEKLREISGSDTLVRKGGQVRDGENWVEVEVWKKE